MVVIFSSPSFYTQYVNLPGADYTLPSLFSNNPKFMPFFKGALGAIDGTHIPCSPPASERAFFRDRKSNITQNCLFGCSFSFQFVYSLTGWEGSASDARVYGDAISKDFIIPEGKYYLADGGYPSCKELLTPYRGIRYHLAEWGRASVRYYLIYFT